MTHNRRPKFLSGLLGLFLLAGCSADSPPLALAPHVDLDRYAGRWYVIANIPYFAERGNVASYFDIAIAPDGTFTDLYVARAKTFEAPETSFTMKGYVVPDTGNARWRESPFWPLYLSYLILHVDPDYQTALVGYPGRGFGWVFARTPTIAEPVYQSLLGRLKDQGYDTGLFRRVPQMPSQLGAPGFQ
jgi:apolipoprotein D and lipocalin family protein